MDYNKGLYIKTYGCQMNVYDSERIQEVMAFKGYKFVDNYENALLVVLNTCHIREKAAEKIYSELGRIWQVKKRNNLNMVIVVAGCVGQAEGEEVFKRAPFVDIVVGPQSYHDLPKMVDRVLDSRKSNNKVKEISLDFLSEEKFDNLPKIRSSKGSSAFVSIQEGCDKFCTFCVVPYTRGAEFSRSVKDIVEEVKQLVDQGAIEIYLLGQNVNAYHGIDENGKTISLGRLIMILAKIDGVERIRYMTSHPIDMHDELYEVHATEKKLMPFLHLPIQSGSDNILKKMNRKHNVEDYLNIVHKLRIARSDIAFSSDFIVGFPGESEQDFLDTISLVKKVNFAQCFSFKYSTRPGTPGALLENQINEEVKSHRLQQLQSLLNVQQAEFNKNMVGKILPVLFDRKGKIEGQMVGKSPYLQSVCLMHKLDSSEKDQILKVQIQSASKNSLQAILL